MPTHCMIDVFWSSLRALSKIVDKDHTLHKFTQVLLGPIADFETLSLVGFNTGGASKAQVLPHEDVNVL